MTSRSPLSGAAPGVAKPRLFIRGVQLSLVPEVEISAVFEPAQEKLRKDKHYGLELEKNELLADGRDELAIVLFVHRIGAPPDQAHPLGKVRKIKLAGACAREHDLSEDGAFAADPRNKGKRRIIIRPSGGKPLLHTAARAAGDMILEVEAEVALPHVGPGRSRPPLVIKSEFPIKIALVHLAIWVVPGQPRGTSTAGVASFIRRDKGKLQELPIKPDDLELKTITSGMNLVESRLDALVRTGGIRTASKVPLPPWLSAWRLSYQGLTWSNVGATRIRVLCRYRNSTESVAFHIDVRQNLAQMVADIDANAGPLALTNPEWITWTKTGVAGMLLARRECRGWVYDLRELVRKALYDARGLPHPPDVERYVCGAYSQRLRCHVIARRHGKNDPQTALHMNGIEACQYSWTPIHDWFGFHLSGKRPDDDPIFIDPWWTQEWNINEVKANHGFKKQAGLLLAVPALLGAEFVLLCYFIKVSLSAMFQGMSTGYVLVTPPTLAEIAAILRTIMSNRLLAVGSLAAGIATWSHESVNDSDATCFDDQLNYSHYDELPLFTRFAEPLQKGPAAPITTEPWPG